MGDDGEHTTLLPTARNHGRQHLTASHFKMYCCIRSKPARLIWLWNFSILFLYFLCYEKTTIMQFSQNAMFPLMFYIMFTPMAGLQTNVKFSRFFAVHTVY